jgi:hypothetical protein
MEGNEAPCSSSLQFPAVHALSIYIYGWTRLMAPVQRQQDVIIVAFSGVSAAGAA